MLADFVAPYNATVSDHLLAADAVIIGKTNMDEFAMGSSNETSCFGPVSNPHDTGRTPGGSSGGSAAAVAAGIVPLALGSDTGGSVRQPAAFCGIVGLKPTYGAVSRYGLVAFASSLDQIGPLAADVRSAALLYDAIHGYDERDSTSSHNSSGECLGHIEEETSGLRIGLPTEYFGEGTDQHVLYTISNVVNSLKTVNIKSQDVSLPHSKYAIATYYIIADAEASSNLARYDGVRYGHHVESDELIELYERSRSDGFGDEVKRRIMLGTFVLSAGYYEAYYRRAQQARHLIADDFRRVFEQVDILVTPTTPATAFELGEKMKDPLTMYLSDIYTVGANLAGLPALSLPCSFDENGLPIGLQLIGPPHSEPLLFRLARLIEELA
jgi:aspartyl-tRNA(Asn)/glutamyl-tRNA(Gln) amidotransferase subunit A